jgi:hypothetical protein
LLDRRDFERLDVLGIDVDDRGETRAAHCRRGGREQPGGARREPARFGRLRQQLRPVAPSEP